jgi:hypothetical protein
LIIPTVSITPSYIALPTLALTAVPQLTVGAFLKIPASLALTVQPTLSIGFFGTVSATLSLSITPTLAVDAQRYVPSSLTLTISPSLTVNIVRVTLPVVNLSITPSISLVIQRITTGSLTLLIIPTISLRGAIVGAGPGWPIVFSLGVVNDGDEAVSSSQTLFEPLFSLPSATTEAIGQPTVTKPYITFKVSNA